MEVGFSVRRRGARGGGVKLKVFHLRLKEMGFEDARQLLHKCWS